MTDAIADPNTPATIATQDPGKTAPPPDPNAGLKEIVKHPALEEKDRNGYPITSIFAATRRFFIYEADGQIRYMLPDDYDTAKDLRKKISELGGLKASIEDLRSKKSVSKDERTRAGREIAWALADAFEDDATPPSEESKHTLEKIDARLRSLVKSHYRKKYVIANVSAFAGIEVILIFIAIIFALLSHPGNLAILPHYALYGACGALGAFLSVIVGIRSIDVDIDLEAWEHVFAGATRILIGVIGGLVVGLALDSKFLDPTLGNTSTSTDPTGVLTGSLDRRLAMYLFFAFIAGFSESLVPNLLRRGEQAAGADQKPPDAAIVKGS